MTPFGQHIRSLRAQRGVTLSQMADDLNISAAYLSALEHGHRGRPTPGLVQQICGYFGIIWDDVDHIKRLAELSHPRITINTSGLNPEATALANELSEKITVLSEDDANMLRQVLAELLKKQKI
jgi:transcriptional regulator with XRE-family HTH domain